MIQETRLVAPVLFLESADLSVGQPIGPVGACETVKVVCGIPATIHLGGGAAERRQHTQKNFFFFAQRGIKLAYSKASVWVVVLDFTRYHCMARASNLANPH